MPFHPLRIPVETFCGIDAFVSPVDAGVYRVCLKPYRIVGALFIIWYSIREIKIYVALTICGTSTSPPSPLKSCPHSSKDLPLVN